MPLYLPSVPSGLVVPTISMFPTTVGTQSATVTDTPQGISVSGSNAAGMAVQRNTTLGSTPWSVAIGFEGVIAANDFSGAELRLRNGASGAGYSFTWNHNSTVKVTVNHLDSTPAFVSQPYNG